MNYLMSLFDTIYKLSRSIPGMSFALRVLYSCDIPRHAQIANSVKFEHRGLGVVIHPDAVIGENCFIQHHVTIGVNKGLTGTPKIGKNVFIGPYAMLLGDITIGDNAVIGAGSIVMKNIEPDSTYTGDVKLVRRK